MKIQDTSSARTVRNGQRGQTLAMVAVLLPVLLGMAALVIDLGYIYVSYQQLVAATQAAALAGGGAVPTVASAFALNTWVTDYSALGSFGNKHANFVQSSVTMSWHTGCVTPSSYPNLGLPPCSTYPACPSGCNMIQVQSSAQVKTFFARLLGYPSVSMSSTAVASVKGGLVPPYHIMMVLDATGSMGSGTDSDCTGNGTSVTPEQCAEYGAQTLLQSLDPCSVTLTNCTPSAQPGQVVNADDQVGIMIFPGLCSSTAGGLTWSSCPTLAAGSTLTNTISNTTYAPDEYHCPPTAASGIPYAAYNNDPEYMILGFQSNYRFSDTSGLNSGSNIFKTVGVGTNNCGIAPDTAHYSTFYAGVIQAAQDYLVNNDTPGVQNIIIFLSDGDANTTRNSPCTAGSQADMCGNVAQVDGPCANGTPPCTATHIYPPLDDCEQAVQAANYAQTYGTVNSTVGNTRIFSISYGSELTGCASDQTTYKFPPVTGVAGDGNYKTPCSVMQGIASLPLSQNFFSVPSTQSGGGTICPNAISITGLNQVFSNIAGQLTVSRLIPQGDF